MVRLVALLLVLVVGLAAEPRDAQASCGDYVVHRGTSRDAMVDTARSTADQGQGTVPLESRPCRGPTCGGSTDPIQTPPPVNTPLRVQSAVLDNPSQLADPILYHWLRDGDLRPRDGYAFPLIDPPILL